ncbi:SusC/RagA family TonB-linked outer membrane protein, partial [uncultured Parabacteroides sp.]|uniref:SusC/RagA family TonB-linked outer membrane protein n=1 Tax=uncultured Parabacteroides sp. TaxID=512312 RepID=UPI002804B027
SHVKRLSARAPQYGMDGSLLEVTKPSLREEAYFGESYQLELSASFQRTFADLHSIDAKAVFTAAENTGYDFWASRRDYLSSTVDQLFAGSSTTMQNSGNSNEGGRMGLVGRLKYDFANRYYIEGSFRYDGSDNFAPGHRWGFFPSVALGWDITEEPFFKNLNIKHIDLFKLRGSYGQMGTESGVNRFGYLSTYNMVENAICLGGKLVSGFNEGELTSPELLSWFTRNSLNYGLDLAFLNHRLKGSVDYFFYVTKGGLVNPADRYTTPLGTKLPQIKSKNEHRREGFELSMRWSDSVGDFQYEVGTNMTYYNNLSVVKQEEALSTLKNPYKRSVHQTDYRDVMLIDNGLYQSVGQILGTPRRLSSSETKLGDIVYQDLNGDGKIDSEDQIRYGMPEAPHFTYGVDFALSYKGFSLSGLFYGTGKRHMELGINNKKDESIHVKNEYQLDYWREDNPDAMFPRKSLSSNVNGGNNQEKSSFWFKNASFLRLKNLSLAYDFKYKLLKNANWLSMCKVNLTGSNLFTISKVSDYFDPETTSTNGGYPVQRVYSVGVTIGF